MIRRLVTFLVLTSVLMQTYTVVQACGPSYLQPIFVFETSPDLPFQEFAAGKIGIVKPTFGRKTLLIAYTYLNGAFFNSDEQKELVSALKGASPEANNEAGLKAWIALRKAITPDEELPEIYRERSAPNWGYHYFPNCANNAFEVATATLEDRQASYGSDDTNVREWVRGQDMVFQNCSGGSPSIPRELGGEAPSWLRKDRDYQIAAAHFYSLQFDDAIARFERIAQDGDSVWRSTAEYLVARSLVRQASLTDDEPKKLALYTKAETQLRGLIAGNGQFRSASQKLAALIKYRIHPEERVVELAELVSRPGASGDLGQDVIDYVWLLDKFEANWLKQEHARREALKPKTEIADQSAGQNQYRTYETVNDELISVSITPRFADGTYDYQNVISIQVKPETTDAEILRLAGERLNRPLTEEEKKSVQGQVESAREYRRWKSSFSLKLSQSSVDHEACYYCDDIQITLRDLPEFLRANDLSDWIFTVQLDGPETYAHAVSKWHATESTPWLIAALSKAEKSSPELKRLMAAAERVGSDSAAFPTIAFHLARLKLAFGQVNEARQLLETISGMDSDRLPVSAQNEFRTLRLKLAPTLAEFLKYSARKPVAFYDDGLFVSIRDLVESRKSFMEEYGREQPREVYEQRLERQYHELLTDDLRLFDDQTADIVDRHFSLQLLQQAANDPQISTYLRRRLTLIVWTRALLLEKYDVAEQIAPEVTNLVPEMAPLVTEYLRADARERPHAALFLLLKSPGLTPFISAALSLPYLDDDMDYYFESSWWCEPSETEYNAKGEEVPKKVVAPAFLDPRQLEAAKQEYQALKATSDAKTYLGRKTLEWASVRPNDPRVPEALFIAFMANLSYKYGCNGWANDEELKEKISTLLRERYAGSPWTAKLPSRDDQ
jgi:hypothetical protein